MSHYVWSCPACKASNLTNSGECSACGCQAQASQQEVESRRAAFEGSSARGIPNRVRMALGILAVVGGAAGIVVVGWQMSLTPPFFVSRFLVFLFAVAYVFSIWCGIAMLRRKPGWLRFNLILWGAQVLSIATPVVSYSFSSGALFGIWVQVSPIRAGVHTWIGSRFELVFWRDAPVVLGLNLFALAITAYLAKKALHRATVLDRGRAQ